MLLLKSKDQSARRLFSQSRNFSSGAVIFAKCQSNKRILTTSAMTLLRKPSSCKRTIMRAASAAPATSQASSSTQWLCIIGHCWFAPDINSTRLNSRQMPRNDGFALHPYTKMRQILHSKTNMQTFYHPPTWHVTNNQPVRFSPTDTENRNHHKTRARIFTSNATRFWPRRMSTTIARDVARYAH